MGRSSQALKPTRAITRPRHSLRMAEVEEGNSPSLPEGMVEISREELKALAEQAGVNVKTTSELVKEERIKVVQGRKGGREGGREGGRQAGGRELLVYAALSYQCMRP